MDLLIVGTLSLLVVAILVAIAARRLHLPYTVGLVIAGAVLALAHVQTGIRLTHDIIFELILPPLLFEAAINIHWHELRREMLPVLVLSIFGVVISAAIVSVGMVWLLAWPVASALVFAVLIAATDPVAVIAMFKDVGLTGRLRLLVESESLFNDGVAAVLFGLALSWTQGSAGGMASAGWALMSTAGGGILIGLVAGAAGLVIVGRTADHLVETAVTLAVAYGAFLGAEYLHLSGVLATVSAGLLMGSVGMRGDRPRFGLSGEGRLLAMAFWEFLAFIANSFVFLLIGVTTARIPFAQLGYGALVIAILLVLLGRAATVYPLCSAFRRTTLAMDGENSMYCGGADCVAPLLWRLLSRFPPPYRCAMRS